jgi:predicted extracellular nuclease
MPTSTPALLLMALVTGCLTPTTVDDKAVDDTGGDDGPSVFDVMDGTAPEGEVVTLSGLAVTSPLNRDGDGFFVADPEGGPNSGLFVWRQMGMNGLLVNEGDEVRITGTPTLFYDWMEFVVDSLDDIEVTGEVDMPAPVELGSGEGVDWNQYDSVAVTLEDQTVTSIDEFQTGTLSGGILLDDGFQFNDIDCGGHYASISGIVFYQYSAWSLNPREDRDYGTYTAPEAGPATVAGIQSGATCGAVILTGVVATAASVEDDGTSTFFVQDATGGDLSGISVYTPNGVATVAVGDVLTLTGVAGEFYGLTQISIDDAATGITVTGTGATPIVTPVASAPSDWEPYEGMLVTLADVAVTSDSSYGEVETNYGIKLDTLYYEHNANNGDTFTSVTGVVYYSYDEWKLEPRDAGDLVP